MRIWKISPVSHGLQKENKKIIYKYLYRDNKTPRTGMMYTYVSDGATKLLDLYIYIYNWIVNGVVEGIEDCIYRNNTMQIEMPWNMSSM